MTTKGLTRQQVAWRLAQDLPDGASVNLGIGMPEAVANFLPADREILLHSENGLLGMGPIATPDTVDSDLINAGKKAATMLPGASIFHHADSFAMIRGGHLDFCVLGAFQVSAAGDLANWATPGAGGILGVGGAMDLAIGAKTLFVMTDHCTKHREPKLVETCNYPLTGKAVVDRVYTDLAVVDISPAGMVVLESVPGLSLADLQALTGAPLRQSHGWKPLLAPSLESRVAAVA